MHIAVLPADDAGCGTYRMILPAQAVREIRPDWQIDVYRPNSVQIALNDQNEAVAVRGIDLTDVDLLVMQRIGTSSTVQFQRWAQKQGIAVCVDADDALWAIDKRNSSWRYWNSEKVHWRHMDDACKSADLTTQTTFALAKRYGAHGRCEVLPNWVPEEVIDYRSLRDTLDERVAIGWTGFVETHPLDLNVVGNAMRRVLDDTGAVARVIGDGGGAAGVWNLQPEQMENIGPLKLGTDYFTGITAFDIGVVPLREGAFNRAKSSLKALEFSAMGLPVVASPTPANLALGRDLPLLFASKPDEWYEHLHRLVNDPAERAERGEAARKAVRAHWTIEANAERWANAWQRAVDRRAKIRQVGR